jgi:hypothetical protein
MACETTLFDQGSVGASSVATVDVSVRPMVGNAVSRSCLDTVATLSEPISQNCATVGSEKIVATLSDDCLLMKIPYISLSHSIVASFP